MTYFLIPNRPPKNNRSIDDVIAGLKKARTVTPVVPPAPKTEGKPAPDLPPTTDFSIEEIAEGYRITGISYRGGIVAYDFAKNVLPSETQDQQAENALKAKPDEFVSAPAPLVYALCKTLHKNKKCAQKDLVEKARQALEGIIGPGTLWINTLSKAVYNTNGKDEIIHDYKQKTQYSIKTELVGPDGYITDKKAKAQEYAQALFGTTDTVEEINAVFKWITGEDSYAYRINSTPKTKQEWVVVLGVVSNVWFYLGTGGIVNVRPALGVRCAKIQVQEE